MACGCGSSSVTPNSCNTTAIVCKGNFVLISPTCNFPVLSVEPTHGTLTYAGNTNTYSYQHDGLSLVADSFTYVCGVNICTVSITVQDSIAENQTVITLTATGTCEIGTPTYEWTIPECASLVEGYTVHNAQIQVIVNNYNPELTLEEQECEFLVDVCCGSCTNCCKCKKFYWNPPVCTGDCENTICNCSQPCTEYNQETGNCEQTCVTETLEHCIGRAKTAGVIAINGIIDSYSAVIGFQVTTGTATNLFFGPPAALNLTTGVVNESALTDMTNNFVGQTITISGKQIKVYAQLVSGELILKFEEVGSHMNSAYFLNLLEGYVVGAYQNQSCGVLKIFTQLRFANNFSTSTNATEIGARFNFYTETYNANPLLEKAITPKKLCCTETTINNCCAEEQCLLVTVFDIKHVENTTGLTFTFDANIPGGTWYGMPPDAVSTVGECAQIIASQEFISEGPGGDIYISDTHLELTLNTVDNVTNVLDPTDYPQFVVYYTVNGLIYCITLNLTAGDIGVGNVSGSPFIVITTTYNDLEWCAPNCTYANNYCAECCNNNQCLPVGVTCAVPPVCQNGTCVCIVDGNIVPSLPNGCCPSCVSDLGCQPCVNGELLPAPVCPANYTLNPLTCTCECDCNLGFCIDRLESNPALKCKPCPNGCSTVNGQWLFCDELLDLACTGCTMCVDGQCIEITCAPNSYPNPLGEFPCCVSCPSCNTTPTIDTYCNNFFYPKYLGCTGDNLYYKFNWNQLLTLLVGDHDYADLLTAPNQAVINTVNMTNLAWNTTGSVFFNPFGEDAISYTTPTECFIKKSEFGGIATQSLLLKGTFSGIERIFEFKFSVVDASCNLLDTDFLENPRMFGGDCCQVYKVNTNGCTYTNHEYSLESEDCAELIHYLSYIIIKNGTPDCVLTVNSELNQNGVVCYEKETIFDLVPCLGTCACDPCNGIGTYTVTIESELSGSTIAASSSVFTYCDGDYLPLLSTCEPASGAETCPAVNNCGNSPVYISGDYVCTSCTPMDCPTGPCTGGNLCGWGVQQDAFETLGWNGNNIQVQFLPGISIGKLCYGIDTECGYFCQCKIITKEKSPEICDKPPIVTAHPFDCFSCQYTFSVQDYNGLPFNPSAIIDIRDCNNNPFPGGPSFVYGQPHSGGGIIGVPSWGNSGVGPGGIGFAHPCAGTCEDCFNQPAMDGFADFSCHEVTFYYTDALGCTGSATATKFCQEDCELDITTTYNCASEPTIPSMEVLIENGLAPYTYSYEWGSYSFPYANGPFSSNNNLLTILNSGGNTQGFSIKVTDAHNCIKELRNIDLPNCAVDEDCNPPQFTATFECLNGLLKYITIFVSNSNDCLEAVTPVIKINHTDPNYGDLPYFNGNSIGVVNGEGFSTTQIPYNILIDNIVSVEIEISCGAYSEECITTILFEDISCYVTAHKLCDLAPKEPITGMLLFDTSKNAIVPNYLVNQKTFAVNLTNALFSENGTKLGFIEFAENNENCIAIQNLSSPIVTAINSSIIDTNNSNYVDLWCPLFKANQELLAYSTPNQKYIFLITDGHGIFSQNNCNTCNCISSCVGFPNSYQSINNLVIDPSIKLVVIAPNTSTGGIAALNALNGGNLSLFVTNNALMASPSHAQGIYDNLFIESNSDCVNTENIEAPVNCQCSLSTTTYDCISGICFEVIGNSGEYLTMEDCNINCGLYGYNCGDCEALVLNGTYATSEQCIELCGGGGGGDYQSFNCIDGECVGVNDLTGQFIEFSECSTACITPEAACENPDAPLSITTLNNLIEGNCNPPMTQLSPCTQDVCNTTNLTLSEVLSNPELYACNLVIHYYVTESGEYVGLSNNYPICENSYDILYNNVPAYDFIISNFANIDPAVSNLDLQTEISNAFVIWGNTLSAVFGKTITFVPTLDRAIAKYIVSLVDFHDIYDENNTLPAAFALNGMMHYKNYTCEQVGINSTITSIHVNKNFSAPGYTWTKDSLAAAQHPSLLLNLLHQIGLSLGMCENTNVISVNLMNELNMSYNSYDNMFTNTNLLNDISLINCLLEKYDY